MNAKKFLLVAAAFVSLAATVCAQQPAAAGEMTVTVESYNILGRKHAHKSPWENRRRHTGALILQADNRPDILGLQECTDPAQHGDMIGMLCGEYDWVIGDNPYMSSRAIFWKRSRFALVESSLADMLEGKYPDLYRGSRYALCVLLREKSTGREMLVYNIHIRAGSDREVVALRKECVDALCPLAQKRSAELGGVPVLVTGDMNNHPDTSPFDIPGAPLVFKSHGFCDTFTLTENRINPDYNSYCTQQNVNDCTVAKNGPGGSRRLDYIFVWPAGRFASSEHAIVINFRDGSEVEAQCPLPSDHHPVRSKLTIKYQ